MVFQTLPTIEQLIPKSSRSTILTHIERITQPVTDFIRGNPIVSTAVVGIGTSGIITGATSIFRRKKKKKKKVVRRRVSRKRTTKGIIRDRKFISKQKHEIKRRRKRKPAKIYKKKGKYWSRKPLKRSKKRVGKTYYTKKGQPYKIMASGKARFIKK